MEAEQLSGQIQAMGHRIRTLYRSAGDVMYQHPILPQAFEELQVAMEELQTVEATLREQNVALTGALDTAERSGQHALELFQLAPVGYLVTGVNGTIRQANHAAERLFETVERFMIGRSLALFVPEGERRAFRARFAELKNAQAALEWEQRMQPWNGEPFDAQLTALAVRGPAGHPTAMNLLVRDISAAKQAERALIARIEELEQQLAELRAPATSASSLGQRGSGDSARRRYAAFAEASVLLGVTLVEEATFARLAGLMVPALADICVIDTIGSDKRIRRAAVAHANPAHEPLARRLRDRYAPAARALGDSAPLAEDAEPTIGDGALNDLFREVDDLANGEPLVNGALMIVPIRGHGRLMGVLTFALVGDERRYAVDDLALAEELAHRAAFAIERTSLYYGK